MNHTTKITLPFSNRIENAYLPTTGIVIEISPDVKTTATLSNDGTFSLILDGTPGTGISFPVCSGSDNVVSITSKPRVDTVEAKPAKVMGKPLTQTSN